MATFRGNRSEESFGGQGRAVVESAVGRMRGLAEVALETLLSHPRV